METHLIILLFIFLVMVVVGVVAAGKWMGPVVGGNPSCQYGALVRTLADGPLTSRQEELVRKIFECLTGHPFPTLNGNTFGPRDPTVSYTKFNPRTRSLDVVPLEVDGYCEPLRVSFEYQGRHHSQPNPAQPIGKFISAIGNDAIKAQILRSRGFTHIVIYSDVCGLGNGQTDAGYQQCIWNLMLYIRSRLVDARVPLVDTTGYPYVPEYKPSREYIPVVVKDWESGTFRKSVEAIHVPSGRKIGA